MKSTAKSIIGILGIPLYDDEKYNIIALYSDYKNAVIEKNCIPFMIPPLLNIDYYGTKLSEIPALTNKEKEIYREMVDMCDGIIMPGGSRMYNYDEYILKYAIDKDIPVLGICLGMQLLANIDNQTYCLETNETEVNHKQPKKKYIHKVKILDNTMLSTIITKKEIKVNSNHGFHVSKVNEFKISAYSEDGLIEAIEMPNKRFVVGVQWHPEKMLEFDDSANQLLDAFVKECSYTKSERLEK